VPGEIVIVQPMACATATRVAQMYYKSGKAPKFWTTGAAASKGWQCGGDYPRSVPNPPLAECSSFSTSVEAQTQVAQEFKVRPSKH